MSANPTTLREVFDFNLAAGSITRHVTISASRVREWVNGVKDLSSPADTLAGTMNAASDTEKWLASISGAFDDNPLYPQILANEREARRLDDEQFIMPE